MNITPIGDPRHKVTPTTLREKKTNQQPITCLTAYDYAASRLVDEAGIDMVLVGDSLAMTMLGLENTLSVTVDAMLHHVRAVRRGVRKACCWPICPSVLITWARMKRFAMPRVEGGGRRSREN